MYVVPFLWRFFVKKEVAAAREERKRLQQPRAPLVADGEDKRRNAFLVKGLGVKTHSHINREIGRLQRI